MTKMTKKVALGVAIEAIGATNDEAVTVLKNMIAQLDKRSGAERKPTKGQIENEGIKDTMLATLAESGAMRATELGSLCGITGQKASALLKQLVDAGKVSKYTEKRVTYFEVAED